MRFFKSCKTKNVDVGTATNSIVADAENSNNEPTELSKDVFFTINGKPFQGMNIKCNN